MQDHLKIKDSDTFVLFCATYGLLWINRAERLAWGKVGKPRGDRTHELRSAGAGDAWGVSASPPDCMLAEYNLRMASPYAMWHHFRGGSKPTDTSNWTMNHGQRINMVHHQQVFFCHFSANPRRLSTTRMPGFGSCPLPFVHVCNSVFFKTCSCLKEGYSERRWSNATDSQQNPAAQPPKDDDWDWSGPVTAEAPVSTLTLVPWDGGTRL